MQISFEFDTSLVILVVICLREFGVLEQFIQIKFSIAFVQCRNCSIRFISMVVGLIHSTFIFHAYRVACRGISDQNCV